MTDTQNQSDLPTALDMLESGLILITGAVLAGPILPGSPSAWPGSSCLRSSFSRPL